MESQGGNKQRPNYWQWRQSFILGDSNCGKSFQVGYPVDMYLSPNWMLGIFFGGGGGGGGGNALSRAHHGVLVPTSLLVGPIDSLPFATRFLASLKKIFLRKSMGGKNCQLFTASATDCRTLARHALKLICQTTFDSILFKSLLSHAGQLSCCDVTEITWPKCGIFSCRRRRCSKHRVCFHSNQYFYVPQENVNLSNEQCVCYC